MARVDDGNVWVGWPGAPGCTTTGVAGLVCCAQTGSEQKQRVVAAISPLRNARRTVADCLRWPLDQKEFIGANG